MNFIKQFYQTPHWFKNQMILKYLKFIKNYTLKIRVKGWAKLLFDLK